MSFFYLLIAPRKKDTLLIYDFLPFKTTIYISLLLTKRGERDIKDEFGIIAFVYKYCFELTWKLKWVCLITFCLSSVCPLTSHIFNILSGTPGLSFTKQRILRQLWFKIVKIIQRDNYEFLKSLASRKAETCVKLPQVDCRFKVVKIMHIGGRWGHKERGDSHRDIQVKIVKISLLENPSPKKPQKNFYANNLRHCRHR